MRLKAGLAILTSVGLLVAPALASACDLSCSLQQFSSDCHAAKPIQVQTDTAAPVSTEPGTHHHEHRARTGKPDSSPMPVNDYSKVLSFCMHEPCSPPSASASSVSGTSPAQVFNARWLGAKTASPPAPYIQVRQAQGESPQLQSATSDPPLISLRI